MSQVISGWMVFSLAFSPTLINLGLMAKTFILILGSLALTRSVSEDHTPRPLAALVVIAAFVVYYVHSSLRLPAMVDLVSLSLVFILVNLSFDLAFSKRVLTVTLSMAVSLVASVIYLQVEQVFFYEEAFPVDLLAIPPGIFLLEGVVLGLGFAGLLYLSKKVSMIDWSLKRDYFLSGLLILFMVFSRILASYTEGAGESFRFAVQANMSFIFIASLALLWLASELKKQRNLNQALALADQDLSHYLDSYMQENAQLQKIRHDHQKELDILHHLIHNHQLEEAEAFLGSLGKGKKTAHGARVWTQNTYMDAVLQIKKGEAQAQSISFSIYTEADLSATDHDLALLVHNLLDNAFAAALQTDEKRVRLDMITESHMLYLKIENTSPPGALEAMEKSKGWGLKIVQEIVQKYKGEWTAVLQEDALVRTEVFLFLE